MSLISSGIYFAELQQKLTNYTGSIVHASTIYRTVDNGQNSLLSCIHTFYSLFMKCVHLIHPLYMLWMDESWFNKE